MSVLTAGWALIGKRPGSYDDYSVLASSSTPFTPRQFNQVVAQNSPGDPPASHETGPAALPWVWFTRPKRGDTSYVGIAIRDWTPDVDATDRPIAETRYFCVALDDFLAAGLTYAGLYRAVCGIKLADRDTDDPVELVVPTAQPPADVLHFDVAAAAAAALLTGPVALLGGGADLADRLAVLDAVAALLPSGAKAWLSAACWADFGVSHPLRLAFTARAREGDFAVDLRSGERPVGGIDSARYLERLLALARERGADAVRRHLAGLTRLRVSNPAEALAGLEEMDLPRLCVLAAREGRLTPDLVRRLDASGRFDDLAHDERLLLLRTYLDTASPHDLHGDRALLARHRVPELAGLVEEAVRTRARRLSWSGDDLLLVAVTADAVDAHAAYGRALAALLDVPSMPARLAPVVGRLAENARWSTALAPVIAASSVLSVAVLRRVHGDGAAVDPGLLDLLDREHGDHAWGRYRRLFVAGGRVGVEDLDELNRVDGDAVPVVLRVARRTGDPGWWDQLSEGFLRMVRTVTHALRPSWLSLVRDWPDPDPATRAVLDFALCRTGEPPRQDLAEADQRYWNALIAAVGEGSLTQREQQVFGDALAAGLYRGWGRNPYSFRLTLEVLTRLADPNTRPYLMTSRLIARIADEVADNPGLLDEWSLRPLLPHLELDPRLNVPVLRARLHWVREEATPHEVAGLVARVYAARAMNTADMAPILMRRWEPGPFGWVDFLLALNSRLHEAGDQGALHRCLRWAELLASEDHGRRLQPAALAAAQQRLLPQVQLLTYLMRRTAAGDRPKALSEDAVALLRGLREQLGDLLKNLGEDGGGLLKKLRRTKSDDHEQS